VARRLDLGGLADAGEKEQQQKVAEEFKDLLDRLKQALGERVAQVRLSTRLTDSPACVVVDKDR